MNRRQVIYGFGAAASGAALSVGTGAFGAAELSERQTNVVVTNDDESLIALDPNEDIGGVRLESGELVIDLEDPGVNRNSIYQFGYFATEGENIQIDHDGFPLRKKNPSNGNDFSSAFVVRNQTEGPRTVSLDLDVKTDESEPGDTEFVFEAHNSGNTDTLQYPDSDKLNLEVDPLGVGEAFGVSFLVDTRDGDLGDDFVATFSVSAGSVTQE